MLEAFIHNFLAGIDNIPLIVVYLFFFLSAVLQMTFPPYPGDTVLIFGGYLGSAALSGESLTIFISYFLGTVVSSYALYELGAWKGEQILNAVIITKYFPREKQNNVKDWVLKFGVPVLAVCKFIPGINTLVIIFSGIFKYKKLWAYIIIAAIAFIHNTLFFRTGRIIGENWENIVNFLSLYNKIVIGVTILGVITYIIYKIRNRAEDRN
jgi:membrane protein DedA with SNARE-associated domain